MKRNGRSSKMAVCKRVSCTLSMLFIGLLFCSAMAALIYFTYQAAVGDAMFCSLWTDIPGRIAIFITCLYAAGLCGYFPIPEAYRLNWFTMSFAMWSVESWRCLFRNVCIPIPARNLIGRLRRNALEVRASPEAPLLPREKDEENLHRFVPVRRRSIPIRIDNPGLDVTPLSVSPAIRLRSENSVVKDCPKESSMSLDPPDGSRIIPMVKEKSSEPHYVSISGKSYSGFSVDEEKLTKEHIRRVTPKKLNEKVSEIEHVSVLVTNEPSAQHTENDWLRAPTMGGLPRTPITVYDERSKTPSECLRISDTNERSVILSTKDDGLFVVPVKNERFTVGSDRNQPFDVALDKEEKQQPEIHTECKLFGILQTDNEQSSLPAEDEQPEDSIVDKRSVIHVTKEESRVETIKERSKLHFGDEVPRVIYLHDDQYGVLAADERREDHTEDRILAAPTEERGSGVSKAKKHPRVHFVDECFRMSPINEHLEIITTNDWFETSTEVVPKQELVTRDDIETRSSFPRVPWSCLRQPGGISQAAKKLHLRNLEREKREMEICNRKLAQEASRRGDTSALARLSTDPGTQRACITSNQNISELETPLQIENDIVTPARIIKEQTGAKPEIGTCESRIVFTTNPPERTELEVATSRRWRLLPSKRFGKMNRIGLHTRKRTKEKNIDESLEKEFVRTDDTITSERKISSDKDASGIAEDRRASLMQPGKPVQEIIYESSEKLLMDHLNKRLTFPQFDTGISDFSDSKHVESERGLRASDTSGKNNVPSGSLTSSNETEEAKKKDKI